MFLLAIYIGIYSYIIFFLGIFGVLYKPIIILATILYLIAVLIFNFQFKIFNQFSIAKFPNSKTIKVSKLQLLLLLLFIFQALINLVGALGLELAFDALWYHLTLPKIFLSSHRIFYISGGLFYYSVMPKLTEMLYVGSLAFGNEITAKILHFLFGILTSIALYKLSRKFFNPTISLLAVVIFYSNLVVDWESITAYIDLVRAFFEVLSLWAFINWIEFRSNRWFIISAVMLGLGITTKVLAIGSLGIFVFLIMFVYGRNGLKPFPTKMGKYILIYVFIALLIPLPWFVFSFVNAHNPVYPFFTKTYGIPLSTALLNPIHFVASLWNLFTHAADPVSPVYIGLGPVLIAGWFFRGFTHPALSGTPPKEGMSNRRSRFLTWSETVYKTRDYDSFTIIVLYSILSLFVWYMTPDTGGGRFIVPYLSVYSLVVASVFTVKYPQWFKNVLVSFVIIIVVISIGYRGVANKKYIPVIIEKESKAQFLSDNLNFQFGDFYDTDGYFKSHITPNDKVLLYGFHNEYYIDFSFIDSSYIRNGDTFDYIAVQHGTIPERFGNAQLVYTNKKTDVKLYAFKKWIKY